MSCAVGMQMQHWRVVASQVRDQLQGPLKTAAEELAKEDGTAESEQPSPADVAAAVEAAMHKLFGESLALSYGRYVAYLRFLRPHPVSCRCFRELANR